MEGGRKLVDKIERLFRGVSFNVGHWVVMELPTDAGFVGGNVRGQFRMVFGGQFSSSGQGLVVFALSDFCITGEFLLRRKFVGFGLIHARGVLTKIGVFRALFLGNILW